MEVDAKVSQDWLLTCKYVVLFRDLQLGHALGCVVNRSLHNGNVPVTLDAANAATVTLAYQLTLFFFYWKTCLIHTAANHKMKG